MVVWREGNFLGSISFVWFLKTLWALDFSILVLMFMHSSGTKR